MRGAPPKRRGSGPLAVLVQVLPIALIGALCAGVGVIHVTSRVMVVSAGYKKGALEQSQQTLSRENERLRLELATLQAPARLEKLARDQLGMIPPPPGAVIAVKAPPPPPVRTPVVPPGARALARRSPP